MVEGGVFINDFGFGNVSLKVRWDPCEVFKADELVATGGDRGVQWLWFAE